MQPEQRTITADVEGMRTDGKTLRGFACLYGVESRDLGGFTETITAGAFSDVLASQPDVYLTFNHSPDKVLARTTSNTLRLRDEERGLAFEADLGDGPTAQDVRDMVRRGDLTGASFRFVVAPGGETWEGERRTLTHIGELIDLSLATTPAYDGPRVELRSRHPKENENTSMTDTITTAGSSEPAVSNTTAPGNVSYSLSVEDRTGIAPEQSIEHRVSDALRSVRKGESRSLTTTSAAAIAPAELSTYVWDRLRSTSVALASGITTVTTDRDQITWPKLTGDVTPGWTSEAAAITPSDPTFATLTATPRKLAALVQASNEVIDDSDPSIINLLNAHVTTLLGLKLDLAVFEGSGTAPEIRGLKNVSGIQTLSMGTNGAAITTLDTFATAINMLETVNAKASAIVMHPRTWQEVRVLKDQQDRYLVNDGTTDAPPRLFGVSVYTSTQLSVTETQGTANTASSIYVYDPSQVVLVQRQDATIEVDRSRLFNSDQSELRGKLRADLVTPTASAIVRITGVL
jgi:HK97 family phage major capsid protein/HK97 family phage prohead protease